MDDLVVLLTLSQISGHKAGRTLRKTGGHSPKTQALKRKAFAGYTKKYLRKNKPTCFCCYEDSSLDFLTIDHKKGKKEMLKNKQLRKLGYSHKRTGKSLNNWLISTNHPPGFQILCWNCNVTKFLYGKCPHKRRPRVGSKKELSERARKAAKKRRQKRAARKAARTRSKNKAKRRAAARKAARTRKRNTSRKKSKSKKKT